MVIEFVDHTALQLNNCACSLAKGCGVAPQKRCCTTQDARSRREGSPGASTQQSARIIIYVMNSFPLIKSPQRSLRSFPHTEIEIGGHLEPDQKGKAAESL